MESLIIKLSTALLETVNNSIIHSLYTTAKALKDEDKLVDLEGNLLSASVYENDINYLTATFPDLHILTSTYYISFEDPEVERCLLTPYGDHGDGVGISIADIPNITRLKTAGGYSNSGCFAYDNRVMKSFMELRRFTALTWLRGNEFKNCTIEHIDLTNILRIDGSAFSESNITGSISLPNLTNIGETVFYGCSNLTNVTSLGYITDIPFATFKGCTNLVSINIPSTCTVIRGAAFENCNSLTTIDFGGVKEIYWNNFNNCPDLETINIPGPLSRVDNIFSSCPKLKNVTINFDNCTSVGTIFSDCPLVDIVLYYKNATQTSAMRIYASNGIKNVYLPKLSTINGGSWWYTNGSTNSAFGGGSINNKVVDMLYLRDVTSIPAYSFTKLASLTLCINNTTPPSLPQNSSGYDAFRDCTISVIYVPDTAVSTYQSDSYWSAYSTYIQPMSNCTKYATEALWKDANKPAGCLIEEYM